ncbi:MAG TPA: anthranilate phosphoribosyltransferase [Moorella mulderi]|nr:anthranilate phosphoribosyltransferase [Moorella mulderi]
MLKPFLGRLVEGEHLEEREAQEAMEIIMAGEATPAQIAAFLTALRFKGETVEEITGLARAMRRRAVALAPVPPLLVDTCGTGGDGRHTFNISTIAAFVVAGAGVPVAKHGNRSVSSRCGSADVLEALGVKVDLSPQEAARCLNELGITFLFAPIYHQAMKHAAGPRKEIGFRTVFNILGPLANPAGAPCQLVGVYRQDLTEKMAGVLARLGCRRAFVVHGLDGLDEVTTTAPTRITLLDQGQISSYTFYPEEVGLPRARLEDLVGGTAEENARIALALLQGEGGPKRDIVLLNAAFALLAAGAAASLNEALEKARYSLDSGAALNKLQQLVEFSQARRTPC